MEEELLTASLDVLLHVQSGDLLIVQLQHSHERPEQVGKQPSHLHTVFPLRHSLLPSIQPSKVVANHPVFEGRRELEMGVNPEDALVVGGGILVEEVAQIESGVVETAELIVEKEESLGTHQDVREVSVVVIEHQRNVLHQLVHPSFHSLRQYLRQHSSTLQIVPLSFINLSEHAVQSAHLPCGSALCDMIELTAEFPQKGRKLLQLGGIHCLPSG